MSTHESKTAAKARATASTAKAAAATVIDTAKDQIARVAEQHFKAADDVAAYGKSNVDALIQAGSIFFRGMEELTKSVVGLTQSHVETSMTAAKAFLSAKTLTELTDLQNAYAKTAFDSAVSEATRLSELAIRITNEAIEPLNARVTATMEHLGKPMMAA